MDRLDRVYVEAEISENGGPPEACDGLEDIAESLASDPEERWPALEGLAAMSAEFRVAIIEGLAGHWQRPGVRSFLRFLGAARDPIIRAAARRAILDRDAPLETRAADETFALRALGVGRGQDAGPEIGAGTGTDIDSSAGPPMGLEEARGRIVESMVGPVDGQGRGIVAVSVRRFGQVRCAAFWCDVRLGALDVLGTVGLDALSTDRMMWEWLGLLGANAGVRGAHGLAVGLLGGSLLLGGRAVPDAVRAWAEGLLGPDFPPSNLPGFFDGSAEGVARPMSAFEMTARAHAVLDACPAWLDRSKLTYELAEEIALREGTGGPGGGEGLGNSAGPDPVRDAGAYRYLFEHLIIHRLELYRRMLLWIGWVWKFSGRGELSRSAFALGRQLSDEQYEVPSCPFTVALSTRSLKAAQDQLWTLKTHSARATRTVST